METRENNVSHVDDTDEDMLDPLDNTLDELGKPGDGAGRIVDIHEAGVYPGGAIGNEPETIDIIEGEISDVVDVPITDWVEFFEGFTDRNMGRLITIEVGDPGAEEDDSDVMIDCLPLIGISFDFKDGGDGSIQVMAGDNTANHITHTITEPTFVYIYRDETGEDEALEIESGDSPTSFIRFE